MTINKTLNDFIDPLYVAYRKADYTKNRGSGKGEVAYKRIGAAYAGIECLRQLACKYHRIKEDPFDSKYITEAQLKRHADYGFDTENHIIEWLRIAGFEVLDRDKDGKQYGYKSAFDGNQYHFAGELDGIIVKSPIPEIPDNTNLECKKATREKFEKFQKNGVEKTSPEYFAQMQLGMAYTDRKNCLFVMVCLDSMEVYYELVPFNLEKAQALNDKCVKVIQSKDPDEMPKLGYNADDFRCMFCPYRKSCWGIVDVKEKVNPIQRLL